MEQIKIIKEELLSDNWYTLKKYTYEILKQDGIRQIQTREVYDRGNGAVILLYNQESKTGESVAAPVKTAVAAAPPAKPPVAAPAKPAAKAAGDKKSAPTPDGMRRQVIWAAAFVLFGLVLFQLMPEFSKEAVVNVEHYGASFGLGVLVFFGVPIAALSAPVPLELFAFGIASTLERLGSAVALRDVPRSPDDGLIADYGDEIGGPAELAARLEADPGVAAHGLFPPDMVSAVLVGAEGTVKSLSLS